MVPVRSDWAEGDAFKLSRPESTRTRSGRGRSALRPLGFYLRCEPSLPTVCGLKQVETTGNPYMSKPPLTPEDLRELIAGLNRLARNLWWTWNQESQEIFQAGDQFREFFWRQW